MACYPGPMNEQERTAQVALAAEGDPDALQRLIIEYHNQLAGALHPRIEPALRRLIDPDDVLQDAYTLAFQNIASCEFENSAAFYRWLERIMINALRDRQRALKCQKRDIARVISDHGRSRSSYPELVQRLSSPDITPSRQVAKGEAVAAVISSLARLTDDQREVVRLRFLEELPVGEVASQMGKSEEAVHMLCHRALKSLRKLLVSITQYLSRL